MTPMTLKSKAQCPNCAPKGSGHLAFYERASYEDVWTCNCCGYERPARYRYSKQQKEMNELLDSLVGE